MCHDLARAVEFMHAAREFAKGYQVSTNVADLIFVRLTNVQDVEIIAAVEARLELARQSSPEPWLELQEPLRREFRRIPGSRSA